MPQNIRLRSFAVQMSIYMLNCLEFSCIHTVRTSSPEICVAILDDTMHFMFLL